MQVIYVFPDKYDFLILVYRFFKVTFTNFKIKIQT
jgi:hypothetical protein